LDKKILTKSLFDSIPFGIYSMPNSGIIKTRTSNPSEGGESLTKFDSKNFHSNHNHSTNKFYESNKKPPDQSPKYPPTGYDQRNFDRTAFGIYHSFCGDGAPQNYANNILGGDLPEFKFNSPESPQDMQIDSFGNILYMKKYYSINPHVTSIQDPTLGGDQKLQSDGSTPKFDLNLGVIPEHSYTRGTHYKIKKYFRENYVLGENGYYYTGQLKNGVKHGWGVDFWPDNCKFYQGEYFNGQRSGTVLKNNYS
jgi:hypothetical protein